MSLLKYVLYLLPTIIFIVECKTFRNDYHFDNNSTVWFKLHTMKRSWHDARVMCYLEGATLASPYDESLKQLFKELTNKRAIKQLYVGIHSTFATGVWHSLDGKPLSMFEDLYEHNFDFSDKNRCAVLDSSLNFLQGVDCSLKYSFVCYKRDVDVTEQTVCGTTDKDYTFDNRTGNCYKFHIDVQTWRDAYEICYAEGAYVAVIDHIKQYEIISDIFKKHRETCGRTYDCENNAYIGIVDWRKNRQWYTIKGVPLKWIRWDFNEPAYDDEFCVAVVVINDKVSFKDISCEEKKVFICEKDAQP